jgi:hypothetical protein
MERAMSSVTDKRFLKLLRLLQQPKAAPAPRRQAKAKRPATAAFKDGFETQAKTRASPEEAKPVVPQRFPDVIEYQPRAPAQDATPSSGPTSKPDPAK